MILLMHMVMYILLTIIPDMRQERRKNKVVVWWVYINRDELRGHFIKGKFNKVASIYFKLYEDTYYISSNHI